MLENITIKGVEMTVRFTTAAELVKHCSLSCVTMFFYSSINLVYICGVTEKVIWEKF